MGVRGTGRKREVDGRCRRLPHWLSCRVAAGREVLRPSRPEIQTTPIRAAYAGCPHLALRGRGLRAITVR